MSPDPLKEKLGAREAHAPNLPFSESPSMNLSEVQTFQKLSVWLRENALPPYKRILVALAAKIEELERVERVRPDDVDEALIWIIGERHHQRVREEMAAYLNDKMAMRALAAHSAAPGEHEPQMEPEGPTPVSRELSGDEQHKRDIEMIVEVALGYGIEVQPSKSLVITMNNILALSQDKPTRAGEPK